MILCDLVIFVSSFVISVDIVRISCTRSVWFALFVLRYFEWFEVILYDLVCFFFNIVRNFV